MIRINLLPVRTTKRQEAVRGQILYAGLGAVAIVLGLVFLHGTMLVRVAAADSTVTELRAETDRMKAVAAQAEQAEQLKADLEKKLDVIKRLKANRSGPVVLLDQLADATPEKLSLTSLDQKDDKIKLAGIAVSNEVISQFLSNLEQSDTFTDVYLNSIEQTDKKGVQVKVFSITARQVVPGLGDEPAPAGDQGSKGGVKPAPPANAGAGEE